MENTPIETGLGRLIGRDCIYLDRCGFEDENAALVLKGSINGDLCAIQRPGRFIPYTLRFGGVLAMRMVELDSFIGDLKSSFDEVRDSEWIRSLGGKITDAQHHFLVQTYDYVVEVVCADYELKVQTE